MDKTDHSWLSTVMFQLLTDFVVWLWLLWFSITHGQSCCPAVGSVFQSSSPFQDF